MPQTAASPPSGSLRQLARVWLTVRARHLAEGIGRREFRWRPELRDGFSGPFNGQEFRRRIVADLTARIPFVALVETGTYRGTTTAHLARLTDRPVHSFEANPRHYGFARARLAEFSNVAVHRSDSRQGLAHLAAARAMPFGPVFFYLDAHGFGALPLADEVDLARRHWPEAVIMIDDFAVPDDPDYGFDDYGHGHALTLDYLAVRGLLSDHVWFPACSGRAETGYRRGCVVLTCSPALQRLVDAVPGLRPWPSRAAA